MVSGSTLMDNKNLMIQKDYSWSLIIVFFFLISVSFSYATFLTARTRCCDISEWSTSEWT